MKNLSVALMALAALSAPAFAESYQLSCEASRELVSGPSPLMEVLLEAKIETREARPGEWICNDAVTAAPERPRFRVTSSTATVSYLKADGSGFTKIPVSQISRFGSCDIKPVVGRTEDNLRFGSLSIGSQRVDCAAPNECGRFGIRDASRPELEISEITWGTNYLVDSDGSLRLPREDFRGGGIGIIFTPSSGRDEEFQWNYVFRNCSIRVTR